MQLDDSAAMLITAGHVGVFSYDWDFFYAAVKAVEKHSKMLGAAASIAVTNGLNLAFSENPKKEAQKLLKG